ncbi:MAG: hypothetical protein CVV50_01780 [Spirochaetae bacterium HGW-Spirochaetae-6]|jgi:membrane-associated phospholipid phosphatase|nr:MAG: hypothetical protein CVV50_01780 [Spirochaetae bacterium HGW-Spirochaetae-6]
MKILTLITMAIIFIPLSIISRKRARHLGRPGIFHNFWEHILSSFSTHYGFWYFGAIAGTFLILFTGYDKLIQDFLQKNPLFSMTFNRISLMIGNIWHLVIAFLILLYAKSKKDSSLRLGALAGFQAVFSSVIVINILKIFTGRKPPLNPYLSLNVHRIFLHTDNPADFSFDFWNHSFRDGRFMWPSGHTASAVAFVSALVAFYPKKHWIKWIGYPLAFMMGIIMIDGDFHWSSDVWAGAFIGHILGYSAGKGFKKQICSDNT